MELSSVCTSRCKQTSTLPTFKAPSSQGTLHATRSATLIDVERRKTALHDVLLAKSLLGISLYISRPGPSACPEISQAQSNQRVQPLPNLVTPLVIQPSSNIQLQPFLSNLHPTIAYCTTNCSISTSNIHTSRTRPMHLRHRRSPLDTAAAAY
ncbi:hypothetical protein M431DRAFT_548828 [Trichoderma harzianum CBS 226.95]|uniref:Uncharacterized protein n=1 Tax=Trichoderma harzianum CBS 226.95 TaxID=983964 RepID=A0A2T4AMG8_TRIHA|nr:hypothetical protein M431DRAFT_548828 [Trichoderma harzianum CBS 226.95]PTB58264.1 hypothetical protein M431DRAFT_548828 [Trichoderma harzianum CBS 226.95]